MTYRYWLALFMLVGAMAIVGAALAPGNDVGGGKPVLAAAVIHGGGNVNAGGD
jgi:hypothetical protein